jgi:hypothetical protein
MFRPIWSLLKLSYGKTAVLSLSRLVFCMWPRVCASVSCSEGSFCMLFCVCFVISQHCSVRRGTRYQKMLLGSKARSVRKADNLKTICEPIV